MDRFTKENQIKENGMNELHIGCDHGTNIYKILAFNIFNNDKTYQNGHV